MAKELYKEVLSCLAEGGLTPEMCGWQVRAKTEEEVMELAKVHAKESHGIEKLSPEDEKKIKSSIKTVEVDLPKK